MRRTVNWAKIALGLVSIACACITSTLQAQTIRTVNDITSWQNAVTSSLPGDSIVWENGVYTDFNLSPNDINISFNDITIKAQTPGSVQFTGTSTMLLRGDAITVEGLVFRDGNSGTVNNVIEIEGDNCALLNCEVRNYDKGPSVSKVNYVRLSARSTSLQFCTLGPRPGNVPGNLVEVSLESLDANFAHSFSLASVDSVRICENSMFTELITGGPLPLTTQAEADALAAVIQSRLNVAGSGTAVASYNGGSTDITITGTRLMFLDIGAEDFGMTFIPADHMIEDNRFISVPSSTTDAAGKRSSGFEAIAVGSSCHAVKQSGIIIQDNQFYRCDGSDELIRLEASDVEIRRNTFIECRGSVALLRGTGNQVHNNYFLGNDVLLTGGIRIFGVQHRVYNNHMQQLNALKLNSNISSRERLAPLAIGAGTGDPDTDPDGFDRVDELRVTHNSLILNKRNLFIGADYDMTTQNLGPENSSIANNLIWGNLGDLIDVRTGLIPEPSLAWQANLIFRVDDSSPVPMSVPTGWFTADPMMDLGDWLWQLDPTNPGPAHDNTTQVVTTFAEATPDIEGQIRSVTPDIGADEVFPSGAPTVTSPVIHAQNVGALWYRNDASAMGLVEFSKTSGQVLIPTGATGVKNITLNLRRYQASGGAISVTCSVDTQFGAGAAAVNGGTTFMATWASGDAADKSITIPVDSAALAAAQHPLFINITSTTGGALPGLRATAVVSAQVHPYRNGNVIMAVSSQVEFDAAIAAALPGDTIQWQDGSYANISMDVAAATSGTANSPITITTRSPGSTVFTDVSHLVARGNYLHVDGLIFRDGNLEATGLDDVIEFKGSHCKLLNCEVTNFDKDSARTRVDYVRIGSFDNSIECNSFGDRIKDVKGNMIVVEMVNVKADYSVTATTTTVSAIRHCNDLISAVALPGFPYDLTAPAQLLALETDLESYVDINGDGGANDNVSVTFDGTTLDLEITGTKLIFFDLDGTRFSISTPTPPNHIIRSNHFFNYPSSTLNTTGTSGADGRRDNSFETIRIGNACNAHKSTNVIVEDNYFFRCDGEDEIVSVKTTDGIFRNNTFVECRGTLSLRQGESSDIYGNCFIGNDQTMTGGVRIFDQGHRVYNNYFQTLTNAKLNNPTSTRESLAAMAIGCGSGNPDSDPEGHDQVRDLFVAHNSFVLNRTALFVGVQFNSANQNFPPVDSHITRNLGWGYAAEILDMKPQVRPFTGSHPVTGLVWEGNLISSASTADSGVSNTGTEYTIADPNLVREVPLWKQDVSKAFASPATDPTAAVTSHALHPYSSIITVDKEGQPRGSVVPDTPDIGADELSSIPATSSMMKASDVGTASSRAASLAAGLIEFCDSCASTVLPNGITGTVDVELILMRTGGTAGAITATCRVGDSIFGAGNAAVNVTPNGNGFIEFPVTWGDGDDAPKTITVPVIPGNLMYGIDEPGNWMAAQLHPLYIEITSVTGGALPGVQASASISRIDHPFGTWATGAGLGVIDPNANNDQDEVLDGLEYALKDGTPTSASDNNILPSGDFSSGTTTISFHRNVNASGILYEIISAPHPSGPWTQQAILHPLSPGWETASGTIPPDQTGIVNFSMPIPINAVREFWKLRVKLVDPTP